MKWCSQDSQLNGLPVTSTLYRIEWILIGLEVLQLLLLLHLLSCPPQRYKHWRNKIKSNIIPSQYSVRENSAPLRASR